MNKDIKFCKIQLNTCKEGMKSFVYEDTYITDPTLDETGRYPVDPKKYYNLTDSQVEEMRKVNLSILENEKTCVICNEKFTGWGNNPSPIKDEGECCSKCDNEKVIPARMEKMYGN